MMTVYTDGALRAHPLHASTGMGGWAWYVHDRLWDSGAVLDTTNNRMELLAVVEALESMRMHYPSENLLIVSDSAYVVNCFAEDWRSGWERRGWISTSGAPVKNRDLWERLFDLYDGHPSFVTFRHCRGHGKGGEADALHVKGNAQADRLAVMARKTLERG